MKRFAILFLVLISFGVAQNAGAYSIEVGDHILFTGPIPEPAALMLLGTGLIVIGFISRKKLRK